MPLLPRFRRELEILEDERKVERIVAASEAAVSSTTRGATAAGDMRRLRGLPVVGKGIPGAVAGTRPGRVR